MTFADAVFSALEKFSFTDTSRKSDSEAHIIAFHHSTEFSKSSESASDIEIVNNAK